MDTKFTPELLDAPWNRADGKLMTCKHEECSAPITRRMNGENGGSCNDHAGKFCPICDRPIVASAPGSLCFMCGED